MAPLTNTAVLNCGSTALLSGIDRQRQFVLRALAMANRCPNCSFPSNYFEAAGLAVDDVDLIRSGADEPCQCPKCGRGLKRYMGFPVAIGAGGWEWRLIPLDAATARDVVPAVVRAGNPPSADEIAHSGLQRARD